MLETLSNGFKSAKNRLRGYRELNESNIDDALRDIRMSLLEADVEFNVVKDFLQSVKEKALGEIVLTKAFKEGERMDVTPGDHFVKICHDELEALMGAAETGLPQGPGGLTKVMMVGLQGSGKTTTSGKLAHLFAKDDRKVCLVAADIYRPAAVQQLQVLGERLGVPVYHREGAQPPEICAEAIPFAKSEGCDTIIFDTAGRLAIDSVLMDELESIKKNTDPDEILFVCDAMIGQDAVKTASEFNRRLEFDGVVLTKLDGDARGGAALSIRKVTGKPVKFVGMGEGLDRLEPFRPEGFASRVLGLGDIVGLMSDFEAVVDEQKAEEDAEKLLSGQFDMTHFLDQIRTIKKMGPIQEVMAKLPGMSEMIPDGAQLSDKELVKVEAMISSMTKHERREPEVINSSRAQRIAKGCGMKEVDVQGLLERFFGMRQMMGAIGQQPGLLGRLPGFKQLSQLSKLKNMDFGQMMGGMGGAGAGAGAGGAGVPPGMIPKSLLRQAMAAKRAGQQLPPELEDAVNAAQASKSSSRAQRAPVAYLDADAKKARRKKQKAAKQARKKGRKKR